MHEFPKGGEALFFEFGQIACREASGARGKTNGAIWCVLEHIFIYFLLKKIQK